MLRNRWLILVGVIVVLAAATLVWKRMGTSGSAVELTQALASAEKRANPLTPDEAIKLQSVTINGETKQAILSQSNSRITFTITPPKDAWFSTALALDPSAWTKEGDGALFRAGVSYGGEYQELLVQNVNPFGNSSDRRWIPVSLDLSAYSGKEIKLVLNINASMPGKGNDTRNDLALWGAPAVYSGR